MTRTGAPWRDLDDHFGKWNPVYRQFRRWTLRGAWDVMPAALNEATHESDAVKDIRARRSARLNRRRATNETGWSDADRHPGGGPIEAVRRR